MSIRRFLQVVGVAVPIAILVVAVVAGACSDASGRERETDPELFGKPGYRFSDDEVDHDITLTAEVAQWELYPGETIEIWGYNGQYPGPTIEVNEGDNVRVTLVNNLPEATAIHWHGLDVPNDQDGVPTITQPHVEPGETWTYEFTAERVGTTVYHSHAHTVNQLNRGLFGAFIVHGKDEPKVDHDWTLQLHEIQGYYTINGHSFPGTLDEDMLMLKTGETARVRFTNMGSLDHPMHLHGHQFLVYAIDGNPLPFEQFQNTIEVAPGQTADVIVTANNPGTWTFHCHIIPHVTNKGVYPGGMFTLLDYTDHTSYFDEQGGATGHGDHMPLPPVGPTPDPNVDAETPGSGDAVKVSAVNSEFDTRVIEAAAGEQVNIDFANDDVGVPHNIAFYESNSASEVIYQGELFAGVETRRVTFTAPSEPGTYFFRCDAHPGTMVGEFVVR